MATYNVSVTQSSIIFPDNLTPGSTSTFSIENNGPASSYFTLETIPPYSTSTPKNTSGSFTLGTGISGLQTGDYFIGVVVAPGGGTFSFTNAGPVVGSTLLMKGMGSSVLTSNSNLYIGLLDTYTDAAAAYSVRLLRSTYTGSAIRVRRSSDNTEQDIGFTALGNLDESALTTFVGANNGFVTTWYDQSGNARNATQSTAANQPRIVNLGTIEKENNLPIVVFDGSNDFLNASGSYSLATGSVFGTVKSISSATAKTIFSRSSTTVLSDRREMFNYIASTRYDLQVSNFVTYPTAQKTYTPTNYALFTGIIEGATSTMSNYINGSIGTTATSVSAGLSGTIVTSIGTVYQTASPLFYMNGKIGEIIVYPSNQSSNRTGIESNINTYYGIY
jgi:hypothetical protein